MTGKESLEKKWGKDMCELVEACTVKPITALQITVPRNVPSNIRRDIRFIYEKAMEKEGVYIPIIFVEQDTPQKATPPPHKIALPTSAVSSQHKNRRLSRRQKGAPPCSHSTTIARP